MEYAVFRLMLPEFGMCFHFKHAHTKTQDDTRRTFMCRCDRQNTLFLNDNEEKKLAHPGDALLILNMC